MKVAIIIFNDFTDLDAFLPFDLLSRGRQFYPDLGFKVTLLGTRSQHTSKGGLTVQTHGFLEQAREADAVIFSSGPLTRTLIKDQAYLSQLKSILDPPRQYIASQCSGALILGALGLLKRKSATTYPTAVKNLQDMGIEVMNKPFVAHERIATVGGCLGGIFLAHWLIKEFHGNKVADTILKSAEPIGQPLDLVRYQT